MAQPDAPHHQHDQQDGHEYQRRAQVGLQKYDDTRHEHVEDHQHHEAEAVPQLHTLGKYGPQCDDQHELDQLRGLQPEERELQPPVRSHGAASGPDDEREDQKDEAASIYVHLPLGEMPVVESAESKKEHETQPQTDGLRAHVVEGGRHRGIVVRCGVEHEESVRDESERSPQQDPIDAAQIGAQREAQRRPAFARLLQHTRMRSHRRLAYSVKSITVEPPGSYPKYASMTRRTTGAATELP